MNLKKYVESWGVLFEIRNLRVNTVLILFEDVPMLLISSCKDRGSLTNT